MFMEKDKFACVKREPNQPQSSPVKAKRTLVANSGTSSGQYDVVHETSPGLLFT